MPAQDRSPCRLAVLLLVSGSVVAATGPPARAAPDHSTAITLTPDGSEVWVVHPDHGTVGALPSHGDRQHALTHEITVGAEPWSVAVHPTNGEAWITSMAEHRIYVVDTATYTVVATIDDLGFETFGIAFNPSGTTALVTASGSDELLAIDVATRAVTHTLPVYRRPRGIAWKPDGSRAWISHLLAPGSHGRLTTLYISTWTTSEILLPPLPDAGRGGHPSAMQGLALAPPPRDDFLWIPHDLLNTPAGGIVGNPLTPANILHAVVSPVNVTAGRHDPADSRHLGQSGTPVAGPIAIDFLGARAYVVHLHSNNVSVLRAGAVDNLTELAVLDVGDAPIGVVASEADGVVYVANWLSRNVTVIDDRSLEVLGTTCSASTEPLDPRQLNGKKLFFTSNGPMARDDVGACASCHVFGRADGRAWDLSQFGKHVRATPDCRGIGFTGAHDWTGDKDEMQDHELSIVEFTGGAGLTGGAAHAPLGPPNAGLSDDLDDLGRFLESLVHRPTTPFRNLDGSLTRDGVAGRAIFEDAAVGCSSCHGGPFYTDSTLRTPFVKHDVGTVDPADLDAARGLDTPSLCGVWDSAPYLHGSSAASLMDVLTTHNPDDRHGKTSHLTSTELDQLVSFLRQIAWPDSIGSGAGRADQRQPGGSGAGRAGQRQPGGTGTAHTGQRQPGDTGTAPPSPVSERRAGGYDPGTER